MKKILRHPLSWVGLALLIAIFAFLLFPETTDTGEEPETETEVDAGRKQEENEIMDDTALGKPPLVAPEPRDETEEVIDTLVR
ncbi:MAG: hypothetical protein H6557_35680 [Lewinellaceae bacterium]|nr:hypothetical protein [Phaeodactylibacter sp.]MCB9041988.1 hypothetical protein [Lewinellaceae bacterium]